MKYYYEWISFLTGSNVVEINNKKEFELFKKFLKYHGIFEVLGKYTDYKDWQDISGINSNNSKMFLFEFHNYKGLTIWNDKQEAIDWYGEEPIKVNKLLNIQNEQEVEIE